MIVAAVAVAIAGAMFAAYLAHPDALWRGVYHDRNGHLTAGMNFALAVKTGDPLWFGRQLLAMNVWGPVHALVLAMVFLVGGVDHRIAILPSLAGWVMTVVLGAMIARSLFTDRALGLFAGALAAIWIAESPAFRLLGADVMLEGLGAGLSALALWTWIQARAARNDGGRWRWLALVLTVLFFEKANYWGLVAGALALTELLGQRHRWRGWVAASVRAVAFWRPRWPADLWLVGAVLVAGLAAALFLRGPSAVEVFGRRVSLYPPDNVVTLAYALAFGRAWTFWRAHRTSLRERLGTPGRNLFYWHAAPLAISFLIPKRLAAFILFVGPANQAPGQSYDILGGAALYGRAFVDAFSTAPWTAWLALALATAAASQWRRYPVGGRAVFVFAALCATGVVIHPLHQPRYLASWIFAVWVCAGAGGAVLLDGVTRRLGGAVKITLAAALAAAFAALTIGAPISAGALEAAARAPAGPSDLALVRPWMGLVAGERTVGVATTFGPSDLFVWALEERCQCRVRVEHPWTTPAGTRADDQGVMLATLAASKARRWVVIDAPASADNYAPLGFTYAQLAGVADAMRLQHRFRPIAVVPLAGGRATATVFSD